MPGNSFIRFDGIANGESVQESNPGKDGWMEISDWNWDIEAEHTAFKGTGASIGSATPGTLSFSHYFDSASPEIMNRIVRGTHFTTVTIQMLKQTGTGGPQTYFEIVMGSVFITKVSSKGAEDGALTQDVDMVFKDVIVGYKAQVDKGSLSATIPFSWDIQRMQSDTPDLAGVKRL